MIESLTVSPFDVIKYDDLRVRCRCPALKELGGESTIAQQASDSGSPAYQILRAAEPALRALAKRTATATPDQLADDLLGHLVHLLPARSPGLVRRRRSRRVATPRPQGGGVAARRTG